MELDAELQANSAGIATPATHQAQILKIHQAVTLHILMEQMVKLITPISVTEGARAIIPTDSTELQSSVNCCCKCWWNIHTWLVLMLHYLM